MTLGLYYSRFFLSMPLPCKKRSFRPSVNYLGGIDPVVFYYPSSFFVLDRTKRLSLFSVAVTDSLTSLRKSAAGTVLPYDQFLVPISFGLTGSFFYNFYAYDKLAFYRKLFFYTRLASQPFTTCLFKRIVCRSLYLFINS